MTARNLLGCAFLVLGAAACSASPADEEAYAESSEAIRAARLPALGASTETTVSGLSSGAFMAVQFHVAHSRTVRGAAVFAGGPFYCAEGSAFLATGQCMKTTYGSPEQAARSGATLARAWSRLGLLDDVGELTKSRVFLFGGSADAVVAPEVVDATRTFYEQFVPADRIQQVASFPGAGHVMPTAETGNNCETPDASYVGKCAYDGAGAALSQLYGPLNAPSNERRGSLRSFDQGAYSAWPQYWSMARTGYVYIPRECEREACRVHVAFHGCLQHAEGKAGMSFVEGAGYNRWADTNRIVVLYPQTVETTLNPNACWDWWGYTGPGYAQRSAPQMTAVRRMLEDLAKRSR